MDTSTSSTFPDDWSSRLLYSPADLSGRSLSTATMCPVYAFSGSTRSVVIIIQHSIHITLLIRGISCSEEGITAILLNIGSDDYKEHSVDFHEALTTVCLEPTSSAAADTLLSALSVKERSFLVGGASGRLVHHRADSAWFAQKDVVLFDGAGSPVGSIAWGFSFVAWSDASNVRTCCVRMIFNHLI